MSKGLLLLFRVVNRIIDIPVIQRLLVRRGVLPDPSVVQLVREGCASKEWLRRNPKVAQAAGYIVIGGKLHI